MSVVSNGNAHVCRGKPISRNQQDDGTLCSKLLLIDALPNLIPHIIFFFSFRLCFFVCGNMRNVGPVHIGYSKKHPRGKVKGEKDGRLMGEDRFCESHGKLLEKCKSLD